MKFLEPAELQQLYGQLGGSARLRLNQPLQHRRSGDVASRAVGDGLDYWDSRPYQPGDDPRHMDWRLSARTQAPYLKRFLAERRPSIAIAVDQGLSMRFGTQVRIKAAQAHRVAVLIAIGAVEQGWAVDHYQFEQRITAKPRIHDRSSLRAHIAELAEVPALEQSSEHVEALNHLASRVRSGTPLYLLSDFLTLSDEATALLAHLAARCTLVAVRLFDPAEVALPAVDRIELSHAASNRTIRSTQDRERYDEAASTRMTEIEQTLIRAGCQVIAVSTVDTEISAVPLPHGWGQ